MERFFPPPKFSLRENLGEGGFPLISPFPLEGKRNKTSPPLGRGRIKEGDGIEIKVPPPPTPPPPKEGEEIQ